MKWRPPGTMAIRVGVILLVISGLVGVVGSMLTLGRLDESSLTRDVVIDGDDIGTVPGSIDFSVAESMSESAPEKMTVAVLSMSKDEWSGRCEFSGENGQIDSSSVFTSGGYIHPNDPNLEPVEIARLAPGAYTVECGGSTGDDSASGQRFTVGRVIGTTDLTSGELSPLLWFGGVLLLAGTLFVTGLIVLIVGLVKRRRHRRGGGGPGPHGWGPGAQGGWPPPGQPGPPGSYGQPGPPGSYGQPGSPGSYGQQNWPPPGQPGPPPTPPGTQHPSPPASPSPTPSPGEHTPEGWTGPGPQSSQPDQPDWGGPPDAHDR